MPRRKMTEEEKKARREAKAYKENVERMAKNLQFQKEDYIRACRENKFPDPPESRIYKVGDRVEMGAIEWTMVYEVLEDGKLYKLICVSTTNPYGRGEVHSFEIYYERWTELLPYRTFEEKTEPDRLEQDEDIQFSYSSRPIVSLLRSYYSSGIDLEPDYQRGNVWTPEQEYMLIDSIYKNIDIGKFTVIRRSFKKRLSHYYEMLDGKQRLIALLRFYESRFRYKGKYFHELCTRDQGHFTNYSVNYSECKPLTDEQKYRYFLKLNTSGKPVDSSHIEKVEKLWEESKSDTTNKKTSG
jgi:hypothetical protein